MFLADMIFILCRFSGEFMTNFESKYNNAKQKMINGLIEILKYKDFIDVSVKELCMISGVNRSTFYAHYENMLELLEDCRNYMIDSALGSFERGQIKDITNNGGEDFISEEYLIPYLRFIRKNHVLFEVCDKHGLSIGDERMFKALIDYVSKPVYKTMANDKLDEVAVVYQTRFFVDGIHSVVREWIKRGFKESEEYICDLILSAASKGRGDKL